MPLQLYRPVDDYGMPLGPEGYEQGKAATDAARQATNAALSMPLTMVAPDPSLPGPLGYIPFTGAAEGAVGMLGSLGKMGARLVNAGLTNAGKDSLAAKWGLHIPDPPQIMTSAGEHFEQNRQAIQAGIDKYTGSVLPQPDLNTTQGNFADLVGSSAGAAIGVAPTSVLGILPRGLKTVGSVLFPTVGHTARNLPITTGLGLAQGAIEEAAAAQPQPQPTTPGQETPSTDDDTNATLFGTGQAAPATPAPPPVAPPAPSHDVNATLFGNLPVTNQSDPNSVLFGPPPVGPTFTQQGETNTPVWAAAATLALTLAGVGAGRFTHSLGGKISSAARDARFNDPEYAARVQEYQNDVISRGPNSGTLLPPGGTPTPAPTPRGNIVRRATTYVVDKSLNDAAQVQNAINLSSSDPAMAERLSAMAGNAYDPQLQHNRTTNFLDTGYDPRTGITLPAMKDLLDDRAALPQAKADVLAQGLKALDEINTRDRNTKAWMQANPGATPSLEDVAHNLMGHGTDELHSFAAAMQADPQLAEMAARYKAITKGMITIGGHPNYGFFDPAEVNRIGIERPDYAPEMDINGRAKHPFGPRDASAFTGQAQIMTDPIRDLGQHIEQLYPQFERNLFNQEMMNHWLDVQRTYPHAAQFMQDVQAPTGAHASYFPQTGLEDVGGMARDPILSVRTPTGVKYLRIDDPITYGAMRNHSLGAARVQLGAANTARRLFQQFTTGLGSTLTGRIVPLRTAIATGLIGPVNAPRNMRAGMLDYALQRASPGGRANPALQSVVRGSDMIANLPGVAASYAMGVGDRRIKNFADLFHPNATNPVNKAMRAYAGDPIADAIHQAAQARWEQSGTKWIREQGIAGAGSAIKLDAPGVVTGKQAGPHGEPEAPVGIRSLSAGLSPKAYFSGDWMGAKPHFLNLRSALGEALSNVSDAGLDYSARLNRHNPNISPEALTYNIRNLYGNPSRKGSGATLGKITGVLPWANIGMQELSSTAGAFVKRPIGSTVTVATGLGTLALISILTHMRSAAHMDFLQNQISTQQREANVVLGLSDNPDAPTEIPLPRSMRVPYAFMLDMVSKAVNVIGARHDPLTFNGVWDGIKDFLGAHITTSDAMAMRHAGVDMGDFVNLPPWAGHIDYNALIQNGLTNLPSAIHGVTSGPVGKELPGQAPASPLDTKSGETFRNILENVFGAAAATLYDTASSSMRYMHQGHTFLDTVGMNMKDWLATTRENNPSLNNMLWETPVRLSRVPPIAEAVQPTLFALKNLPAVPVSNKVGYTAGPGRDRLPVPTTGETPVAQDPQIIHLLQIAHGYSSSINDAMAPITALKAQMGAVEKFGMNPQEKREQLNKATREMADRYKLVSAYTADMYHTLSALTGKPITSLSSIDWSKGMDQFAK